MYKGCSSRVKVGVSEMVNDPESCKTKEFHCIKSCEPKLFVKFVVTSRVISRLDGEVNQVQVLYSVSQSHL